MYDMCGLALQGFFLADVPIQVNVLFREVLFCGQLTRNCFRQDSYIL